jgi:hypothetical protein
MLLTQQRFSTLRLVDQMASLAGLGDGIFDQMSFGDIAIVRSLISG